MQQQYMMQQRVPADRNISTAPPGGGRGDEDEDEEEEDEEEGDVQPAGGVSGSVLQWMGTGAAVGCLPMLKEDAPA
jgi:hypothetical protein